MNVDRAPLVPPYDGYLVLDARELERLQARLQCQCGRRAAVADDGLCVRCGHTRDWRTWLAEA